MEVRLLLIGVLAVAPIGTILVLEQWVLLDTVLRDSNPLKFALLVLGWLGIGAVGAGLGGLVLRRIGRAFLPAAHLAARLDALRVPVLALLFLASLAGGIAFWGQGMH
jgi:hypothetical protein